VLGEVAVAEDIEARFERYCEVMVEALSHADRRQPACWYLKGLMLPGGRKSVEPMAARVHPQNVRSAHQSMHHLVADADWSDELLLGAVAGEVVPVLTKGDVPCFWIADDTGFVKKGEHSVGVARQYCGRLGKTENCQVAVSLALATARGSLPVGYRLYLPREWAEDPARRERAKVPREIGFATKGEIALAQVEAALAARLPRGVFLADAGYGDETALRERLSALGLLYAVGVRPGTAVWWGAHQPAPPPAPRGHGRPPTRLVRDKTHQPVSVLELAQRLSPRSFRQVTWREGVAGALSSRFARVRVRAAHANRPRAEEWLLIEWPQGEPEPTHYWFSTLTPETSFKQLVATAKARWMIERDYEELKSELGLHHFEGRGWRGFHHHASLCIAAYGFLMLERLSGSKKTLLDSKNLPYPKASARAGLGPMQRHIPWSIATMRYRLARAIARALTQCPCCGLCNVNGARLF
jgi:SRSO17 transposase